MKPISIALIVLIILGSVFWKKVRMVSEIVAAPGYSRCEKCGRPWKFVNCYPIMYTKYKGMFAVCEECWNNSTLPELKKYYGDIQKEWSKDTSVGPLYCNYNELMDSVESEFKRTHKP